MELKKAGSCTLIIIIISSIITLYYINTWHSVALMQNLTHKKYEYDKLFRLTNALYKYGLMFTKENFDQILKRLEESSSNNKQAKFITLFNGPWPPENSETNTGLLKFHLFDPNKIDIEATVIKDNLGKSESITIRSFIIKEEVRSNNKEKKLYRFVVSHWRVE